MSETLHSRLVPFRNAWRRWIQGLSFPPVFVLLASVLLLIFFHENCSSSVFRVHFARFFQPSEFKSLYPAFFWYGCSFLVLGLIPLALGRLILKRPLVNWGIGLGDWRFGLKAVFGLYLAFLPVLALVCLNPTFQSKYPIFHEAEASTVHFLLYELAYAIYFIGWEFIFRGFMLFGLQPALGLYTIFIQAIPFAIMHFGKPQLETFAAVGAGVVLGYLGLRTRSFWYGWMLHTLIATTNDLLVTAQKLSS